MNSTHRLSTDLQNSLLCTRFGSSQQFNKTKEICLKSEQCEIKALDTKVDGSGFFDGDRTSFADVVLSAAQNRNSCLDALLLSCLAEQDKK